jgi:hypothetical protein
LSFVIDAAVNSPDPALDGGEPAVQLSALRGDLGHPAKPAVSKAVADAVLYRCGTPATPASGILSVAA